MTVCFASKAQFRQFLARARLRSADAMPRLLRQLRVGSDRRDGQQRRRHSSAFCTKTATVPGIILGEVDFLAGAKAMVDAMLERAEERARGAARVSQAGGRTN